MGPPPTPHRHNVFFFLRAPFRCAVSDSCVGSVRLQMGDGRTCRLHSMSVMWAGTFSSQVFKCSQHYPRPLVGMALHGVEPGFARDGFAGSGRKRLSPWRKKERKKQRKRSYLLQTEKSKSIGFGDGSIHGPQNAA